jgi:dTMP kinase
VCDRYAYSGVAFSAAKGMDLNWCKSPDVGLPAPDAVIYLDIDSEDAAKRGNYGDERYEKVGFQRKVAEVFATLRSQDDGKIPWHTVKADQSIEDISLQIRNIAEAVIQESDTKSIKRMWIDLP